MSLQKLCKNCANILVSGLGPIFNSCASKFANLQEDEDKTAILESLLHLVVYLPPSQVFNREVTG
jgi:cytochrome c551/c552